MGCWTENIYICVFVVLANIIHLPLLSRLFLRLPQTQSQFGRQGDWAFAPVSGSRAALQRPIQHPEWEARPACHQGQVQGPDWGGGGEEGPALTAPHVIAVINHQISAQYSGLLKATECRTVLLFCFAFVLIYDNFVLCCCRRASVTRTSGKGVWKMLWRFVFVCVLCLTLFHGET